MLSRTVDLNVGWVRLADRVSWRALQPNEGDPIRWDLLAGFEDELRVLKQAGIAPVVSVNHYPRWATTNIPYPTDCGPLRADKFEAFAQFFRALVERYAGPEFDVHQWELGNEPDVDPRLVGPDNGYGCWGDIQDPFYGGRHYGEMLKVVGPAIKAADPSAQVWIGGLLLDRPETTDPAFGRPELFLQGILEAGAGPAFDVVAYHAYANYFITQKIDFDNATGWVWDPWGGYAIGKARFLGQIMTQYGVRKPLVLNEMALTCPPEYHLLCTNPDNRFYDVQASYVVRTMIRAIGSGVAGMVWYVLEGPGWRFSGLLDGAANPQPAYIAYQQLNRELQGAEYAGPVFYAAGVEGHAFSRDAEQIQVVWTKSDAAIPILVPQSDFIRAVDRDGRQLSPTPIGEDFQLMARFEPIYIILRSE